MWDRVGLKVDLGWVGAFKKWDTSFMYKLHIHHNSNNKITIPSSIFYAGGLRRSAKMDSQFLRNANFHILNKSGQCSPKHKLILDFLMSYDR